MADFFESNWALVNGKDTANDSTLVMVCETFCEPEAVEEPVFPPIDELEAGVALAVDEPAVDAYADEADADVYADEDADPDVDPDENAFSLLVA